MYYRLIWHIIRENLNIIISFYNILKLIKKLQSLKITGSNFHSLSNILNCGLKKALLLFQSNSGKNFV